MYLFLRNVKGTPVYYVKTLVDGKWKAKSLGTSNKAEAKRKLDFLFPHQPTPSPTPSASSATPQPTTPLMTVKDFRTKYLEWANVNKGKRSVQLDTIWFNVFTATTNIQHMEEATLIHVETFKRVRTQEGNSPVTVNGAIRTLKAIWNKGIMLGYLADNPFAKAKKLKVPQKPPRFLSDDEIVKLMEAAEEWADEAHRHRNNALNTKLAIALALYAGMRKNEVCNARWEWVDLQNRTIKILNSDDFTTKSGKFRTIPLHETLADILRPHQKPIGFILEECVTNQTDRARYRVDFRESFLTVCEKAGVKVTFHECRHTFATRLCAKNVSLAKVQKWLGHADIQTTMIYAHVAEGFDSDINAL